MDCGPEAAQREDRAQWLASRASELSCKAVHLVVGGASTAMCKTSHRGKQASSRKEEEQSDHGSSRPEDFQPCGSSHQPRGPSRLGVLGPLGTIAWCKHIPVQELPVIWPIGDRGPKHVLHVLPG